ncbi:unnamed protein product [Pleuronectes platessa]|uniref:Uncharacterized protein n=1 Tax=Pleuronectes platessa TaxID=8262 RepID=A0A9N7UYU9_PLEPL|nr:unnamed protein product [Pleuronectes platessa]
MKLILILSRLMMKPRAAAPHTLQSEVESEPDGLFQLWTGKTSTLPGEKLEDQLDRPVSSGLVLCSARDSRLKDVLGPEQRRQVPSRLPEDAQEDERLWRLRSFQIQDVCY